jgi:polar amino acid transport system substrate-binding protein
MDSPTANYHIVEKFNNEEFKILDEPVTFEKYGVAFKKGNDGLKDQVQKTLDEMFKDGTVERIAQNYSDYGINEGVIYP